MKKSVSSALFYLVVSVLFIRYSNCSQWPQWIADEKMQQELVELGVKPTIFGANRVLTDTEVEKWFDTPPSRWNLRNIGNEFSAWCAGKSRIEKFFDEIKHPTDLSLEAIQRIIFEDDEMRYALDPITGLPPVATLMVAYLSGSESERRVLKTIFTYFLDVETSCSYNLEHQLPLSFRDEDLDDLKALYLEYHEDDFEGWQVLCDRLKDQSNTLIRLQNVAHTLSDLEQAAKPKDTTIQSKHNNGWNALLVAVGAAVGYAFYRYMNKNADTKAPVREHTAEYAQLFKEVR